MSNNKSEKELENSERSSGLAVWWKETLQFLREVWIEVRPKNGRVTWPTFASVRVSTRIVIISSIGLGLFIGLCDALFAYAYSAIVNGAGGIG